MYAPFIQKVQCISSGRYSADNWDIHDKNIDNTLQSWNFTRVRVGFDGNCFFEGVAMNIVNRKEMQDLLNITCNDLQSLVTLLRKKLVEEWTGENRDEYMGFIQWKDEGLISREEAFRLLAEEFLIDGFFHSDLGDAMPLGMSNALKLLVVLFTSSRENSVMYITPRNMLSSTPIFLKLNFFGDGHYNYAAYSESNIKLTQPASLKIGCSCGVNAKVSKPACNNSLSYRSRCRCFKSKIPCTDKCRCKHCCNHFGQRPLHKKLRSRSLHKWQNLIGSDSIVNDVVPSGKWSVIEKYVFLALIQQLNDCLAEDPPTTLTKAFNEVVNLVSHSNVKIPGNAVLAEKSSNQIAGKIKHYKTEKELFTKFNS